MSPASYYSSAAHENVPFANKSYEAPIRKRERDKHTPCVSEAAVDPKLALFERNIKLVMDRDILIRRHFSIVLG